MNAAHIRDKLDKGHITSNILLGQAKLLDGSSRNTPAFNDPRYFPFYYYLGQVTRPKKVEQIGVKLGLIAACFMQGCPEPVEWQGMETMLDGNRPPMNIINSNMKMFYKAKLTTEHQTLAFCVHPNNLMLETEHSKEHRFDMGLLTDKYEPEHTKIMLEYFWKHLAPEGLLVVDYIQDDATGEVFREFCRVKNREPQLFETRYGVGMVTR